MRRLIPLMLSVAIFAAACGDDAGSPGSSSSVTEGPVATEAPGDATDSSGSSATETTTVTSGATPTTEPEGEPAPDFTLALGEGGTFTLSDEQKPVYLVFWAEW